MIDSPIIVALDFDNKNQALNLVDKIDPAMCRLKVGKEMFTLFGPQLIKEINQRGFDIFLDLKFHDIPNTVAKAVAASAELGVWMVNVHASGGIAMMDAARKALITYGDNAPILIAVTLLTSMNDLDLQRLGINVSAANYVKNLAQMTKDSGLNGVVCSAQEAQVLKSTLGQDFKLITPGIRPLGAVADDQHRIMTPKAALAAGADYLVIGRPITQAADPSSALQSIYHSIK